MTLGGSRRLPEPCLERLAAADAILHAGDVMDAPTWAEIEAIGPPVYGVQGNVDDSQMRALLPLTRVVELGGVKIAMVHDGGGAEGRLERLRTHFPDADAVIFGHSHVPLHEEHDGFQIFNPGSPTDKRRQPEYSMGEAVISDSAVVFSHIILEGRSSPNRDQDGLRRN